MQDEPEVWWRRHGFAAHAEHNECPMGSMRGTVRHFWSFAADAAGLVLHAVAADDEWSSGHPRSADETYDGASRSMLSYRGLGGVGDDAG
jgi:hypothetical protein